jgi:hypothetical protein
MFVASAELLGKYQNENLLHYLSWGNHSPCTRSQSTTQTVKTISRRANTAIIVAVLFSLSLSASSGLRYQIADQTSS